MKLPATLLTFLLAAQALPAQTLPTQTKSTFRTSREHLKVTLETFGADSTQPVVILLHGSDGPTTPYFYDRGRFFAAHGFQVLYPHYYEAAPTREQSQASFDDWVGMVRDLVQTLAPSHRKVYLLGFSQGAEIALTAGAQGIPVDGIAEWYGALFDPDRHATRTYPPLLILHGAHDDTIPPSYAQQIIAWCATNQLHCENHIYPNQGHGFAPPDLADADTRTLTFFNSLAGPKE